MQAFQQFQTPWLLASDFFDGPAKDREDSLTFVWTSIKRLVQRRFEVISQLAKFPFRLPPFRFDPMPRIAG
jgi:hypothetical protein